MPSAATLPRLEQVLADLLANRQQQNRLRSLTTVPPGTVDFSSNAYLSLSSNTQVLESYLSRIQRSVDNATMSNDTMPLLGSGGSRLLDGNSEFAESLERELARFHDAPTGLLFNSAMDANIGVFSSVPQRGDIIVYDELIHASIHDGMRLSQASKKVPFTHNVVFGRGNGETKDIQSLEAVLQDLKRGFDGQGVADGTKNVFIAVEGVYSMDGDVAPLEDVAACAERMLPQGNGYIVVDEAHSLGLFGERGRGLVCQLGLENRVWARVLGFGKALGCAGGIVLCSQTTRSYLVNYARTLIYTTALPYTALAGIEVAYRFLMDGRADPLLAYLHRVVQHAHNVLLTVCARHRPPAEILRIRTENPKAPVIPLLTAHPRSLASYCQARGFMVRPIVAPTVAKEKSECGSVSMQVTRLTKWIN